MALHRWSVGDVTISRIPYFDIGLPPDAIGLTAEAIAAVVADQPDAARWLDGDDQPLVGQALWVIESAGSTVVVDPCGAADDFLRTGPSAVEHQQAAFAAFENAGYRRESVDWVVLSHLDGIGMAAWVDGDGSWAPAFPAATILISGAEHELIAAQPDISGAEVFAMLDAGGAVATFDPPHRLVDGVTIEATGGHSDGHSVISIESNGEHARLIGHLAVSPLDLLTPHGASHLHMDPPVAADALAALVEQSAADGGLLIGPLWPEPGAVRVIATKPVTIEPVAS